MNQILENMAQCYGCTACVSICPKKAITMTKNAEGFLYPVIDDELCVDCGFCQTVCPALHNTYDNLAKPIGMAAAANDEIRSVSSSGGIFPLYAQYVLKRGGAVCGAAYDDNWNVKHIIIEDEKDIRRLQGSKYVQSEMGTCYFQIKKLLEDGRYVLFTGTPCQVAGLKGYLRQDYEKLLTIDLICHGVPSPKAFRLFLKQTAGKREIAGINFRHKVDGKWGASNLLISYADGDNQIFDMKSSFYHAFGACYMQRSSCQDCQFSRFPRQGDVTIGDFWQVNGYNKELNDNKGVSIIFVNNEKGLKVTNTIDETEAFILDRNVPASAVEPGNPHIYTKPVLHHGRDYFYSKLYETESFAEAERYANTHRKDIGILSFYYANNYGAALTAYALYKAVEDFGYQPTMIDVPYGVFMQNFDRTRNNEWFSRKFINDNCRVTGKLNSAEAITNLNKQFDCFLVGSDQLWRKTLIGSSSSFYFLDFAEDSKKKIAYATSTGGDDFMGSPLDKEEQAHLLRRFDAISIREENTVKLLADKYNIVSEHVLDPVFICDKEVYERCADDSKLTEKDYVFAYLIFNKEENRRAAQKVADKLGKKAIIVVCNNKCTVSDWLYLIKNAAFVVTDSYHAFCFSMLLKTPFMVLRSGFAGGRFESMTKMIGYAERFTTVEKIDDAMHVLNEPVNFEMIYHKLQPSIDHSRQWLKTALEAEKDDRSAQQMVNRRLLNMEKRLLALEKNAQTKETFCTPAGYEQIAKKLSTLLTLNDYFDYLSSVRSKVTIVVSAKDDASRQWKRFKARTKLNMNADLFAFFRGSYVSVIDAKDHVYYDAAQKPKIGHTYENGTGDKIYVESQGYINANNKGSSVIRINDGENLSLNLRGLNIVVLANDTLKVIDSVNCDTCEDIHLRIRRA